MIAVMSLCYVGLVGCVCSRPWIVDLCLHLHTSHMPERLNENAVENVNMRPVINENMKSMWVQYMLSITHNNAYGTLYRYNVLCSVHIYIYVQWFTLREHLKLPLRWLYCCKNSKRAQNHRNTAYAKFVLWLSVILGTWQY